jgi:hypothetical protein
MRDGKLKITFDAGEIVVVSVNAGLDLAYQRLFEAAKADLRRPDPSIEAGIRLTVFGCFWLEAICNETLRKFLRASMKPPAVAEAAWEALKRGTFHAKLDIVSAFAKRPDAERARRVSSALTTVFELRNRLAHFKDEDIPVAGPLTLDEFQARFDEFPDADLIAELRPPSIEVYADAISSGIEWLHDVDQQHFPSETRPPEETTKEAEPSQ